ncbi:MAG: transposase [Anaerolineae bacterium]|nr:transposase [Anaerolineae bacterium]
MTIPGPTAPTWHSRGYVPHFDAPHAIQHVTYHLADSLPADALARLEEELRSLPPQRQDPERRKRIEALLDAGHGSCVLRAPSVAGMVQASLLHFDGERYRLLAWVVMPNHVHILFEPLDALTVAQIVASWKSFTGRRIAEYMDRYQAQGQAGAWRSQEGRRVWQREYWDRFIRDERHFNAAMSYIHQNPVKAGLVRRVEDWEWSSARLEPGEPL